MSITKITFNKEMKKAIAGENHPVLIYVNKIFEKSFHTSYYGFFDRFLYKLGIVGFGSYPSLKVNKYLPYINCKSYNIFFQEKGITNLSNRSSGIPHCNKVIVEFIVSRLKVLNVQQLDNWDSQLTV